MHDGGMILKSTLVVEDPKVSHSSHEDTCALASRTSNNLTPIQGKPPPACNYSKDSEVSLKRGELRQIKAKTENPTYCPPPTCTPIPQCFLNKNLASLLLNHPKCCRHHPTTACFVSGRSFFTHSQNRGFP